MPMGSGTSARFSRGERVTEKRMCPENFNVDLGFFMFKLYNGVTMRRSLCLVTELVE